jgi:lysophospholipase L1-like esterase
MVQHALIVEQPEGATSSSGLSSMRNPDSLVTQSLALVLLSVFAFPPCFAHDSSLANQDTPFSIQKFNFFKIRQSFVKQRGFGSKNHLPAPPPPPPPRYVPHQVSYLLPNDKIVIAGDSVTYLGFQPSGWVSLWQQYVQTYYPTMNLQFLDYGVPGNHSADLLTQFPTVLQNNPTVVLIYIGLNDGGYGTGYLPQQSANIQAMIDQCKATPSVRTVVLISPFCWGEQRDGQNPFDSIIDAMGESQARLAAQNNCPFIDLRTLWNSSEYIYNQGDTSSGILTEGPPGVHPNALGAQIISGAMIKSFGE